ncbi:MAG: (Fe-S)-binding protein [Deltaproteobacteria bacterium]|nr:(Fe-S)-binding protein [Candidatus Anaeroferrophillus wilburensis]MBN2889829.1 (Fe-S)-binding protein [Deltaproteobacteria bacterium]
MREPDSVTLFITCLIDGIYPEVGTAVVSIFEQLGIMVDYPTDQTCCGQPAFNAGYRREARAAARRFIEIFEHAPVIVAPSGSCVHMVRHHYPQLFQDDSRWLARARQVAAKTFELTEYLVDILGITDLGASYNGRITYHDSCHLRRGLGIAGQPRALLAAIKGATFIEMTEAESCCGFGGVFSVKYPEISTAMVEKKVNHIIDSGAHVVTGCDISCLMNIAGRLSRLGSPVRCLHIAQLLAGREERT